jgi:hypothetical protein
MLLTLTHGVELWGFYVHPLYRCNYGDFSRFQILHHFHRICTGEPHVSATGYACPVGFKLLNSYNNAERQLLT